MIEGRLAYSKAVSGIDSTYTEDSILEVASLTKLITTIAALQLVERGFITLHEDVSQYIPGFACQNVFDSHVHENGSFASHQRRKTITLHRLLTHTAGAGYGFTDERIAKFVETSPSYDADGTVDGGFNFPLSYEPGEGWKYSNSIDRVGQIIEKISGLSLEEYFKAYIFQPLGISNASFMDWGQPRPAMAVRAQPDGPAIPDPEVPTFTTGLRECFGGQGLLASLQDYIKILHSLLVDDEILLKSETTASMFRPGLAAVSKRELVKQLECATWTVGDLPHTGEYNWGYGGLLIDGDSHPYRSRNTLTWSGAPSLFWVR